MMLILTRRSGEAIMIGRKVRMKVLRTKGGVAYLGFVSEGWIPIDRQEVYERKKREQAELEATSEACSEIQKT
jgi:carbon storage regulator CsrA